MYELAFPPVEETVQPLLDAAAWTDKTKYQNQNIDKTSTAWWNIMKLIKYQVDKISIW